MIKRYNYFVGMRITVNHANISPNTYHTSKAVIDSKRDAIFSKTTQAVRYDSGVNQTLPGYLY
jgi:hypothetical protein